MQEKHSLLKRLLTVVGLSHIALGILGLSGATGQQIGARVYGTRREFDDQLRYVVGLTSGYLLSMGILQLKAASDPQRHRAIIDATLIIYLLNGIHRVINRQKAYEAFGISPLRLWLRVLFFGGVGAVIFKERLKLKDEA